MVGEDERRGAGAALAAIDRDEVHAALPVGHPVGELVPEVDVPDRRLDADRQPGRVREPLDEVEHRVDVAERGVPGRADEVLALLGTPRIRAISALTLAAGNTPPRPGFAPWLSLISIARTGPARCRRPAGSIETAVLVAAAEVAGADLPDEVAALAVVVRDAALAGVVPEVGDLGEP